MCVACTACGTARAHMCTYIFSFIPNCFFIFFLYVSPEHLKARARARARERAHANAHTAPLAPHTHAGAGLSTWHAGRGHRQAGFRSGISRQDSLGLFFLLRFGLFFFLSCFMGFSRSPFFLLFIIWFLCCFPLNTALKRARAHTHTHTHTHTQAYVVSPRARGGAEGEDAGGGAIGDGRGRSPSHSPVASHANSTSPLSAISGYRQTR